MNRRSSSFLLITVLSVLVFTWGGLAQAYLSPDYTNPAYDPGGVRYPFFPGPGDKPDYLTTPNWANSPMLRKFVDTLPGVPGVTSYSSGYTNGENNLGQQMPLATPDIATYPGSDYYAIQLEQYTERMHSDLNPTTLRGYRQMNNGTDISSCSGITDPAAHQACVDAIATSCNGLSGAARTACLAAINTVSPQAKAHFLGPIILAEKDRPVRVKFINALPTGAGGDLFIPVDTTIMGAGPYELNYDPILRDYQLTQPFDPTVIVSGYFKQNRATLHLHGGRTPWISDGTPHQWITPAGEATDYPTGLSVENVPDMPDPGPGAQTFYWTNQQSARLMFYHDHAWGITRLNVYAGEAAGYIIMDDVEKRLIADSIIPAVTDQIPLVIEDRTFVDGDPLSPTYVRYTDPLWNWGTTPKLNGVITNLTLTSGGTGYTVGLVAVTGAGTGATAEILSVDGSGAITSLVLMNGGSGYTSGAVIITGTGTGAAAQAFARDGILAPVTGDLWWPHVYMPAQNPFDITGIAPLGRWAYGPYFFPAPNITNGPVPNPYFNIDCDPTGDPATTPGLLGGPYGMFCQAPEIPGTPDVSWGAEAFLDTQTVNGTAFPTITVEPKSYRLRILNASHDRFVNLSLFKADATVDPNTARADDPATPWDEGALSAASAALCSGTCATNTEVRMIDAAAPLPAGCPATWPTDGRAGGVPDCSTASGLMGPSWIMIGTEGGFLPMPVVIPPHPISWNVDVTTFNAGNINGGSLMLGPAERADVIVDFKDYEGQTLILYNDAPAPWPALDPHYDYYTGSPDNRDIGGADTVLPGFGPNIRTIMQIKVAGTPAPAAYDVASLKNAFDATTAGPASVDNYYDTGVFARAQDTITVGQGDMNAAKDPARYETFNFDEDFSAYNKAYGRTGTSKLPTTWPNWGISRINDKAINFVGGDGSTTYKATVVTPAPNNALTMNTKAIHDEMGATFDDYGRLRAGLGLENFTGGALQVNFIVQTYSSPATEILPEGATQVWKITHNGVDTHPIHFHLYDVQVLNRVGWDGFIRLPDPNEMGWKDTVRISPLEDTIVAVKPVTPKIPFGVPESIRPLNPATLLGDTLEISQVDPYTGNAYTQVNEVKNFDWEYVWHCHILSHEENDMMRPVIFQFAEALPGAPFITGAAITGPTQVDLTWSDPTPADAPATLGNHANEMYFRIDRSVNGGAFTSVGNALANATTYADQTVTGGNIYRYTVTAVNAAGEATSNIATAALTPPDAPSGLAAIPVNPITVDLSWTDNSANENTFEIQRSPNGCAGGGWTTVGSVLFDVTTYQDMGATPVIANGYQVRAVNTFGGSAWSNCVTATPPAIGAPSGLTATYVPTTQINLAWTDNSIYETSFTVQRKTSNVCDNNGWTTVATAAANASGYSDINLIPDRYTYRVGATMGASTEWSNCATAIVPITTAPTLITPSGIIAITTPTYRWTPVPGATGYSMQVYDYSTGYRINGGLTMGTGPGQVDCTTVPGECSVTPTITLNPANHWWRVLGRNAYGSGPWSSMTGFSVVIQPPSTPSLVAPIDTSTVTTSTPTYQWSASTGVVTNYRLVVTNGATEVLNALYTPLSLGCNGGGICSVKPGAALTNGGYTWHVRGENLVGVGSWSTAWSFTVAILTPPAAPTPLAPLGPTATNPVTYRWTNVSGATGYSMQVYDYTTGFRINGGLTMGTGPGQVDCTTVPGECSVTPPVTLNVGASHWWRVVGRNAVGTGTWSVMTLFTMN